jgi:hypothetical protein
MGGWFSSFFAEVAKVFGEHRTMRFLMVGLDNAGKTTILYAMKYEPVLLLRCADLSLLTPGCVQTAFRALLLLIDCRSLARLCSRHRPSDSTWRRL